MQEAESRSSQPSERGSRHSGLEFSRKGGKRRERARLGSFFYRLSACRTQNVPPRIFQVCASDHLRWLFLLCSLFCTCLLLVTAFSALVEESLIEERMCTQKCQKGEPVSNVACCHVLEGYSYGRRTCLPLAGMSSHRGHDCIGMTRETLFLGVLREGILSCDEGVQGPCICGVQIMLIELLRSKFPEKC